MFELTIHLKHEMIRMLQRFNKKFEFNLNQVEFVRKSIYQRNYETYG